MVAVNTTPEVVNHMVEVEVAMILSKAEEAVEVVGRDLIAKDSNNARIAQILWDEQSHMIIKQMTMMDGSGKVSMCGTKMVGLIIRSMVCVVKAVLTVCL